MEEISNNVIRVKKEFINQLQNVLSTDEVLNTVKWQKEGESQNDLVCFWVQFSEKTKNNTLEELQAYVNSLCDKFKLEEKFDKFSTSSNYSLVAGEDSSYDSDYEGSEEQIQIHDDVTRTVSDTLAQEFSEYVSIVDQQPNSAYQSRVEFALKLGYTEKLVQTALQKLGSNPEQNELLAELIKLGAHHQSSSKLQNDSEILGSSDEFFEPCLEGNKLRPIVIDGSNLAMSHGNKEVFSCKGIKICVDWFRNRGHNEITVFVPKWRKEAPRADNLVIDQEILYELEKERLLVFTPSREIRGKRLVCYDDRYILKLAAESDGIVVSNDNYRDLIQECPEFRKVIEERILMYSFVNDRFMPPDDPLGRSGPTLDNFLKMSSFQKNEACPYGKKCTYGYKCKYSHPERGIGPQKSITEKLVENAQKQLLARNQDSGKKLRGKSLSLPLQSTSSDEPQPFVGQMTRKQPLFRTKSTTVNSKTEETNKSKLDADCYSRNRKHAEQQPPYYRTVYPMNVSLNQTEVQTCMRNDNKVESEHSINLHRKLQRELSINPTCDPRIYQMQRQITADHMPASRHYSYKNSNCLSAHSNVTRISSAPPANHTYTTNSERTHNSNSDPQLNLSVPSCAPFNASSNIWPIQNPHNYPMTSANVEDTRCQLHYHLASIFPKEQVDAAMQYYPNETNPQKICAAILSMFSK